MGVPPVTTAENLTSKGIAVYSAEIEAENTPIEVVVVVVIGTVVGEGGGGGEREV